MRKIVCGILFMLMSFTVCACGIDDYKEEVIVSHRNDKTNAVKNETEPVNQNDIREFIFEYNGIKIIPGKELDLASMPEPVSVYSVPSCAIEGTDDVYEYDGFEIIVCSDEESSFVYSIYFIEPTVSTTEGLHLGDMLSKVDELYSFDYSSENGGRLYTLGSTQLRLIIENDLVSGIEYLYVI